MMTQTVGRRISLLVIALLMSGCQPQASQQAAGEAPAANSSSSASSPVPLQDSAASTARESLNAGESTGPGVSVAAPADPVSVKAETSRQAADRSEPLLEGWTKPAVALLLTGEQHGYLEPCGCSERQSGGLSRRADLVRQLQERGWTVTGLDLGGTLKRSRRQSEMKFEFTRDALNILGYKGLGLGPEELKLSVLKLFEAYSRTQANEQFDVLFVSANVVFFGTRDVGTPQEYRVFDANGVKLAVTSVLGQTFQEELFPAGAAPDPGELLIERVDAVLPGVIERMQAELGRQPGAVPGASGDATLMILLSQTRPAESAEIAKKYPQFDLVVTAGSPEDPLGKPEYVGKTMLVKVGEKGKHAGLVGFYPEAGELRFTTIELDRFRFDHAAEIDRLMERYQQQLKDENLVAREPAIRHPFGPEYEYLGSAKCAECHADEYDIWKDTPHAHAYDSLTVAYAQASDDPSLAQRVRVDRIHDPECINCHTAGWDPQDVIRFESGFTGIETTPHLVGVNCENCHGPASRHVALEEEGAADDLLQAERRKLHVGLDTAEVKLCIKCHDYENSPDFNFETYWPQIEH